MSAAEINARVLALWKGASHGGIDPEEWDEIFQRRSETELRNERNLATAGALNLPFRHSENSVFPSIR